uniref:Uncharacterized protein n=1 Tax=Craspedostauros australis TaxID=1486917 RepID=A0A6T6ECK6_9STRA|mmetsp:Transcript_12368/g.34043  ORF Transcript_12368/g.34043 Transcript_12368/m.34043 type:complete len:236 (+) Transcript_12368:165-872(+)|eukprot:CAMPEP_0198113810 /NCGR_PEP_ID=MMETSP1442-20131203/5383_1 /TAXON_ID= /ORGANISM="Craspedostauros australis, Strain CCMP3328" /LENGTH=235 /DNA_ID=CAMNT_0043770995 /DNA_START=170 /DNA_END=877 /DNA_ORIENTATION=+
MLDSIIALNMLQTRAVIRQQKRASDVVRSKHIKDLFTFLQKHDEHKELLQKAKIVVKQCSLRRKIGDPNFKNMIDTMEALLRELVGDELWLTATTPATAVSTSSVPATIPSTSQHDQTTTSSDSVSSNPPLSNDSALRYAILSDVLQFVHLTNDLLLQGKTASVVAAAAKERGIVLNPLDMLKDPQIALMVDDVEPAIMNVVGQTLYKSISEQTILQLTRSLSMLGSLSALRTTD